MKTIEVTTEQYEALKQLNEILNTQDNRATCLPIIYQVRDRVEVVVDGFEEAEIIRIRDLKTNDIYTAETGIDNLIEVILSWLSAAIGGDDGLFEEFIEFSPERIDFDEIVRFMTTYWIPTGAPFKLELRAIKSELKEAFLTDTAADTYLKTHSHELVNPYTYVIHVGQNQELAMLLNLVSELQF